jgi:hypothetical protein
VCINPIGTASHALLCVIEIIFLVLLISRLEINAGLKLVIRVQISHLESGSCTSKSSRENKGTRHVKSPSARSRTCKLLVSIIERASTGMSKMQEILWFARKISTTFQILNF